MVSLTKKSEWQSKIGVLDSSKVYRSDANINWGSLAHKLVLITHFRGNYFENVKLRCLNAYGFTTIN